MSELGPVVNHEPISSNDLNPKLWILQRMIYYQKNPKEFFWSYMANQNREDAEFSIRWMNRINKAREIIEVLPTWQGKAMEISTIIGDLDFETNPTVQAAYEALLRKNPLLAYNLAYDEYELRLAGDNAALVTTLNEITGLPHVSPKASLPEQIIATEDLDRVIKLMSFFELTPDEEDTIKSDPSQALEVLKKKISGVSTSDKVFIYALLEAKSSEALASNSKVDLSKKDLRKIYSMSLKEQSAAFSLVAQIFKLVGDDEGARFVELSGRVWTSLSTLLDTLDEALGPQVTGASAALAMTNWITAALALVSFILSATAQKSDATKKLYQRIFENQRAIIEGIERLRTGQLHNRRILNQIKGKLTELSMGQVALYNKISDEFEKLRDDLAEQKEQDDQEEGRLKYNEYKAKVRELRAWLTLGVYEEFRKDLLERDPYTVDQVRKNIDAIRRFGLEDISERPFVHSKGFNQEPILDEIVGYDRGRAIGLLPQAVRQINEEFAYLTAAESSYLTLLAQIEADPYYYSPVKPPGYQPVNVDPITAEPIEKVKKLFGNQIDPAIGVLDRPVNPDYWKIAFNDLLDLALDLKGKYGFSEIDAIVRDFLDKGRSIRRQIQEVRKALLPLIDCYTNADKEFGASLDVFRETYGFGYGTPGYVPRPIYADFNTEKLELLYSGFSVDPENLDEVLDWCVLLGIAVSTKRTYLLSGGLPNLINTDIWHDNYLVHNFNVRSREYHATDFAVWSRPPPTTTIFTRFKDTRAKILVDVDGYALTKYGVELTDFFESEGDWLPTRLRVAHWCPPFGSIVSKYLGSDFARKDVNGKIVGQWKELPVFHIFTQRPELFEEIDLSSDSGYFADIKEASLPKYREAVVAEMQKLRTDFFRAEKVALSGEKIPGLPDDITNGRLKSDLDRMNRIGALIEFAFDVSLGELRHGMELLKVKPFLNRFYPSERVTTAAGQFNNWRYSRGGSNFEDWFEVKYFEEELSSGDVSLPESVEGGILRQLSYFAVLSGAFPELYEADDFDGSPMRPEPSSQYKVLRS